MIKFANLGALQFGAINVIRFNKFFFFFFEVDFNLVFSMLKFRCFSNDLQFWSRSVSEQINFNFSGRSHSISGFGCDAYNAVQHNKFQSSAGFVLRCFWDALDAASTQLLQM